MRIQPLTFIRRSLTRLVQLCIAASLVVYAVPLPAQHLTRTPQSTISKDSSEILAAALEADTGRMMPGYQDLSRYNTPGYCLSAVTRVEQRTWRTSGRDTVLPYSPEDTLSSAARQLGKACIAAIDLSQTPPEELYNLASLALQINDTAKARAAVTRHLAVTHDPWDRGWVLSEAIDVALSSRPVQHQLAQEWLTQLTQLGHEANEPIFMAYGHMENVAHRVFDTAQMLRASLATQSFIESISPDEHKTLNVPETGKILGDSMEYVFYNESSTLTQSIQHLLDRIYGTGDSDIKRLYNGILSVIGEPYADFLAPNSSWFPDSATKQILMGKVTLVISHPPRSKLSKLDASLVNIRRLYNKYKDQGFQVMVLANTEGYAWESPPLKPDDEAQVIGWFYREYLHLPFSVVVQKIPYSRLPDGRRVNQRSPMVVPCLVGRDGKVFRFLTYGFHNFYEMDAYIKKALAENPQLQRK